MLTLQHPYISVDVHGRPSFGGGQQLSPDPMLRRCGCGIIAAADLLLYLSRYHTPGVAGFDGLFAEGPIPLPDYNALILRLHRRYFPVIPYYTKTDAGVYIPTSGARAHFITVTGLDETWMQISSWGRRYYLSRAEFIAYARGEILAPASNILLVERKA